MKALHLLGYDKNIYIVGKTNNILDKKPKTIYLKQLKRGFIIV